MRIAIDAMGGDFAPRNIVEGAVAGARHVGAALVLVGPAREIADELSRHPDAAGLAISIVDAPDVVGMAEPSSAVGRRRRASIRVAIEAVARGDADAVFTAGHTGAAVMAAHGAFGMLPGVDRPALVTAIPTRRGTALLLDAGASIECRPHHLVQFATMGSVYARLALDLPRPRVGLLSIGEEETKGNDLTREAHRLLKESRLDFVGNVEARAVYSGQADVIVCDGFTGNVALKVSEGLVEVVEELLREELFRTFSTRVGYLLSRRAFRRFQRRVDYSEYGGAPLVGMAGLLVVGHGRSSVKAVRNAVVMAHRFAANGLLSRLAQAMAPAPVPHS